MDETNKSYFLWLDYVLFGSTLGINIIIGIYFGYCVKKQNTVDEYLKGGKKMKMLPIAASLIASQIATNTLLAAPADVYRFGANYIWLGLAMLIQCLLGYFILVPVLYNLQVTTVYEYLQLRFDRKLKLLAAFLNVLSTLIFCPMAIYVPALAFSQATGLNVMAIVVISSVLCIFYTAVGGFKAVVWTDALQLVIMIISFFAMFCIGISSVGGFHVMWEKASEGHRLDIFEYYLQHHAFINNVAVFNYSFSFDPTQRDSFGALTIGGSVHWFAMSFIDPVPIQKYLSLPTFRDVKRVVLIYAIGAGLIHSFAALSGVLIYSKYWNCDPLSTKQILSPDQIVPYFVLDVAGKILGFPGIFIAGVFSASLSSLSASFNTVSAVIYDNFVSAFVPKNISEQRINTFLKIIIIVFGTISMLSVLVLRKVDGIFPVFVGIYAATIGPTLGLYLLGVLIPKANSKGALFGGLLGMVFVSFVFVQNQRHQTPAILEQHLKPVSIEGCNISFVQNVTKIMVIDDDLPFFLYRISFWFNTIMGTTVTMIAGVVISLFTKHDRSPLPKELLCPLLYSSGEEKSQDGEQNELMLVDK